MPPSANYQRFPPFKSIPLVQFLKYLADVNDLGWRLRGADAGQDPARMTWQPHGMSAKDAPTLSPARPRGLFAFGSMSQKVNSLSQLSLATGSSEINMLIHKLSTVIITVRSCNYKRH